MQPSTAGISKEALSEHVLTDRIATKVGGRGVQ